MKLLSKEHLAGDAWGGLAAMLVALPSAIAFGVTIFAPLGGSYPAYGALAGILGATALGFVAPLLGGTNRLITAPCAPAAAVLSALAIEQIRQGVEPASVLLMLTVIGLLTGALQVLFGAVRLGRLIKYMPYPVVSGYLSGVGLIIITSQVPKLLGTHGAGFAAALTTPSLWQWQAAVVGAVTIVVMAGSGRFIKAVPAAIVGLAAAVATYFGLALGDHRLLTLAGNGLVIGPLGGGAGAGLGASLASRWSAVSHLRLAELGAVIVPALTLAVLLSIDTLKTCVVLDTVTRSRHNSNKELIGQGCGNLASALLGGIPGAGTMGATLVNISSGGTTRRSSVFEGVLALLAFVALGGLIAWIPVAALAGILIVVGVRMIDRNSLHFLRSRSTLLDFAVIAAVVVTALTVGLIEASGVGVALAILLFLREQIGGTVVRRKASGHQSFSKQVRLPAEMEILRQRGDRTVIFELQGSLFFGTADQLYTALEPELKTRTWVILDMRRVQSVDVTAAHVLEQVEAILGEHKGVLILSQIPRHVPSGRDMERYFGQVGLVHAESGVRLFGELDQAMEWVEDRILEEAGVHRDAERPLELHEIDLFAGRKEETMTALAAIMRQRAVPAGQKIFARGDTGDDLFLIRRGLVRIELPLGENQAHHLASFGRGDFFGEMAFLDRDARSADAMAHTDTDLYVLSRADFDRFAGEHKRAGLALMEGLARVLAIRLRYTNAELRVLQA